MYTPTGDSHLVGFLERILKKYEKHPLMYYFQWADTQKSYDFPLTDLLKSYYFPWAGRIVYSILFETMLPDMKRAYTSS